MKLITVEEHVLDPGINKAARGEVLKIAPYYDHLMSKGLPYYPDFDMYADMGDKRIEEMDRSGISMQVLSCPSEIGMVDPEHAIPLTRAWNDRLSEAVKRYPDRFAGFACLPWADPKAAAEELVRAVTELGLKGALLGGRPSKEAIFLDDPRFDPVMEAANRLEVPIYIHPGSPTPAVQADYYGRMEERLSGRLSVFGWGWHNEAGIQVLRMILSGSFERFPKLQVISGHWGEFVPFFLFRLDQALPRDVTGLSKSITETYREHVYVSPSGIFDMPQLSFAMDMLGAERILYSVDFPLIGNEGAREFLENAPISDADKEKIAYRNAAELLKLNI